ncbi:uncharacterized protein [Amphiura filiformis]|uniref:uncharacterized protein n=1 Tax=Amphiura filiformis TaxID=82378 RepID=UPI003B21CE17
MSARGRKQTSTSQYGKALGPDSLQVQSKKDWHTLCSEFNLCKRKLEAKKEALLILAKELDMVRQEKDAYQLMAEQLREKFQAQRRKYEERERSLGLSLNESDPLSERRNHSLIQILCEARQQNKKSEAEIAELHQKLAEAHGDVRLLRENIARQRVGDDDFGARHFPAHEREELVQQLEEVKEQLETLQRDMVAKIDEQEEVVTERDFFRDKGDRLNQELNYVLGGDERRLVDIDALIMENKYVKERLKQCQEEKATAQTAVAKYKNALEKRRGKGGLKLGATTSGGLIISQKQVEQLLAEGKAGSLPVTQSSIADLRSLASTLLETVHDKNMALNHQRNTNKILGQRVAELEKKLKTLEIAGLWNLPPGTDINSIACCMVGSGGRSSNFANMEKQRMQAGLMTLIPHQISMSESSEAGSNKSDGADSLPSVSSSAHESPVHKVTTKREEDSLISLLDGSVTKEALKEDVVVETFHKSSSKMAMDRAASLDLNPTGQSSNPTAILTHSNSLDLNHGQKSVKDLLGDELSVDLSSTSDNYGGKSIMQPATVSKTEIHTPPLKKCNESSEERGDETLISLADDTLVDLGLVDSKCESNSKLDSNSDSNSKTQDVGESEIINEASASESKSEEEEDNLKKISAVIDEANEQKELDVYIVDVEEDEDDYEDFEKEEEEMERFVTEEETPFLTSEGDAAASGTMEDKDVEHLQGFFEGVADRIATKNLEKSMGVAPVESSEKKDGVEGDGASTMESLLIPKEKPQRPLTVSGEEDDSFPQCV